MEIDRDLGQAEPARGRRARSGGLLVHRIFNCPVRECEGNDGRFCTKPWCWNYVKYRDATGLCETCGLGMEEHPVCGNCGILCGSGHLDGLPVEYRGRRLCGHCISMWRKLENEVGRECTYDEFLRPRPSMLKMKVKRGEARGWMGLEEKGHYKKSMGRPKREEPWE